MTVDEIKAEFKKRIRPFFEKNGLSKTVPREEVWEGYGQHIKWFMSELGDKMPLEDQFDEGNLLMMETLVDLKLIPDRGKLKH